MLFDVTVQIPGRDPITRQQDGASALDAAFRAGRVAERAANLATNGLPDFLKELALTQIGSAQLISVEAV